MYITVHGIYSFHFKYCYLSVYCISLLFRNHIPTYVPDNACGPMDNAQASALPL